MLFFFSSLLLMFKFFIYWPLVLCTPTTVLFSLLWLKNVEEESLTGFHNSVVKDGLKLGFFIFVFSEIMLFVSLFWAFLDSSLTNMVESGLVWPPFFITPLNPLGLPLMNTMLLLFSSVLLTWAHISFYEGEVILRKIGWTIMMGLLFVFLQFLEYSSSSFTYSSGVYGSVFFTLTGLHGSHVLLGGVFLAGFFFHYTNCKYSNNHSLWLDLSSFYWHFVDVVWFFVWGFVYIWGF